MVATMATDSALILFCSRMWLSVHKTVASTWILTVGYDRATWSSAK